MPLSEADGHDREMAYSAKVFLAIQIAKTYKRTIANIDNVNGYS